MLKKILSTRDGTNFYRESTKKKRVGRKRDKKISRWNLIVSPSACTGKFQAVLFYRGASYIQGTISIILFVSGGDSIARKDRSDETMPAKRSVAFAKDNSQLQSF